ncbi:MAG: acyl-CoA dehydrogenase family protein [Cyanobacteriota/Melainabacteria group bacterium]
MNTFLSSLQTELFEDYKRFLASEIEPRVEDLENDPDKVKSVFESLGQKGFLGTSVAKEYGGCGEPFIHTALLIQALGQIDAGLAMSVASHLTAAELIQKFGTDTQKSRYLPLLARGECIATVAATEEGAGSDYMGIAARVDKESSLTAEKTWVVNGDVAELAVVTARGEESPLGLWLVDLSQVKDAVKVSANIKKLGLAGARTNNISFKNLKLDDASRLGGVEGPASQEEALLHGMDFIKVLAAAAAVGLTDMALAHSVDRARSREQFGSAIGKLQAIQWKLADMSSESCGARLLTYRAAWSKDEEPTEFRKNAAMCKYYAARVAQVHSAEAVQIFGAAGLSCDLPMEKLYRDAKVMEIAEGTAEIQKNIVAHEIGS